MNCYQITYTDRASGQSITAPIDHSMSRHEAELCAIVSTDKTVAATVTAIECDHDARPVVTTGAEE